jgi:hypothetical protein
MPRTFRPSRTSSRARLLLIALSASACALSTAHVAEARSRKPEKAQSSATTPTPDASLATWNEKTTGLERRAGLFPTYLDPKKGEVWLELARTEGANYGEALYVEGLLSGLGSNPVGLDRGQIGDTRWVRFRRLGSKIFLEQPNLRFRAESPSADERAAVAESFATSALWAFEIAAERGDGRVLVNLTPFLLRDAHGVSNSLAEAGQGTFSLDERRSALDPAACLSFPDNLEFEALLTFQGAKPGRLVREVAPTPEAVTLVAHHSLIRLPDAGYRPRRFDPRSGSFGILYGDYAAALDDVIDRRLLVRHRLEKVDPAAAVSAVKEPIVYYVDRGAPEQIQKALVEGASWWNAAFEAAGFRDAFRVEILPPGAHPLDVRYNVIQWVHRSTRGWSYGGGVIDPRTGEMLKGHVTLGSLRVRQDRLLFEGLAGVAKTGSGADDDPIELSLDRIRQLSAHEVGHTLGFAHNFAASTYGRASVMDYPAPWLSLAADGTIDFSRTYASGIGEWDKQSVRYAYSQGASAADEAARLQEVLRENEARGLVFLTDADARPADAADPRAALWDNGADPADALRQSLAVRAAALARFGRGNLKADQPLAKLHEVFVPLYLHHRYEVQAAAKLVGGVRYDYSLNDSLGHPARTVPPAEQRRGLAALVEAVTPEALEISPAIADLLLPRPHEHDAHVELFTGRAGLVFDPLSAAATAARLVFDEVLQPGRLARVVDQSRTDPSGDALTVQQIVDAFSQPAFGARAGAPASQELRHVLQGALVERLLAVAGDEAAAPWVRSRIVAALDGLDSQLAAGPNGAIERAHRAYLRAEIARFRARDWRPEETAPSAPAAPPGQPIGTFGDTWGECDGGWFGGG